MRLVTYRQGDSAAESVGVVEEETVYGFRPGLGMVELLSRGNEVLLAEAERARSSPSEVLSLNEVVLRAPVPVPPSIRDFLAFEQHIRNARGDVDPDWYELPVFYFSNPAAVHGPFDDVAVSPGSEMFDFELEVAAVIGTEGGDLTPSDAELHIAGYTVLCDFSARDLQQREMRQHLGPA